MEPSKYEDVCRFLEKSAYPERIKHDKGQRVNFRRMCKNYRFEDNLLYFNKLGRPLRVVKTTDLKKVLDSLHIDEHGGHMGIAKSWRKISARYYWKGSYQDVKRSVEACDKCQRKGSLQKTKKPLRPIPVPSDAFQQIGMDLVGPLEETAKGNKYIVVMTEYLTKWVEAEAVPDKSAETILLVLLNFICRHGCPQTLITDQGREFCNSLNTAFSKKMGIEHRIASAYHPQTGGHTERYNRTLCTMLSAYMENKETKWEEYIPYVLFAYRTAEHSSTKATPFYLVYGRQARLPLELDVTATPEALNSEDSLLKRCEAFIGLSCSREDACANIKTAQKKQKQYHDAHVKIDSLKVGDRVLLHNTRRLSRKGGKLGERWTGPYTIKSVKTKGTYLLDGHIRIVNGSRLKPYHEQCVEVKETKQTETGKKKENTNKGMQDSYRKSLPIKKRKIESTEEVEMTNYQSPHTSVLFEPIDENWQTRVAPLFGYQVRNKHGNIAQARKIRADAKPSKIVEMRGDGNCLFRALSYVVFGVQSYHATIRNILVNFIREKEYLFKELEKNRQCYLSRMEKLGTWGTELEIYAFATITQTPVYVYCCHGANTHNRRWIPYGPLPIDLSVTKQPSVYIQNLNKHFEPVFDVEDRCEFSRPPYMVIRDHVPKRYWQYISEQILESSLVNSHSDEAILEEQGVRNPIFVRPFKDTPIDIPGAKSVKMDPNIFNFLCDWEEDFVSCI